MVNSELKEQLRRAVAGDKEAADWLDLYVYGALEEASGWAMFYAALGDDREDAMHSAWMKMRGCWRKMNIGLNCKSYIYIMARNELKRALKRIRRHNSMYILTEQEIEMASDDAINKHIRYGMLHNVIDWLDDESQDLLRRRFWARQTLTAIADEMCADSHQAISDSLSRVYGLMRPPLEAIMDKEEWLGI